jgi:hypothetical protein
MFFHKDLTKEKWCSLNFFAQMANIGAEVGRAINWSKKDKDLSQSALYRGLELLDLTIEDKKNKSKLKELCRLREVIADYFCFDNIYKSTDTELNNYFYSFAYASVLK